jgi:hypothetical protein
MRARKRAFFCSSICQTAYYILNTKIINKILVLNYCLSCVSEFDPFFLRMKKIIIFTKSIYWYGWNIWFCDHQLVLSIRYKKFSVVFFFNWQHNETKNLKIRSSCHIISHFFHKDARFNCMMLADLNILLLCVCVYYRNYHTKLRKWSVSRNFNFCNTFLFE